MSSLVIRSPYPTAAGGVSNVTDDFNRADNASSMGTASDGIHAWTNQLGTCGINSNQAYCPTLSGGIGYATVNYGARDCTIEVTISVLAKPLGLLVGWEGAADLIRVENFTIATVSRTRILLRRTGQADVAFGTTDGIAWAAGDVLKVVVSGSTITVFRNGVATAVTATDARFNDITGLEHGLYFGSTSLRFDNLSITP